MGRVPFANHDHPGNPCIRNFGAGKRVGKEDRPSGAMVSAGATSTPLISATSGCDGAYARLLSEQLPEEAPQANGLKLAEFFCCSGGIGLGFRSAGFELAFANDIDDRAAESYGMNLGHAPLVRDIRGVQESDLPKPGAIDVVTGGFPCVTFSMAGRRMGVVDDENGKLYLELCRVISTIKPRYFVAENVEGMLSANGGAALKLVLASFLKLGYRTVCELVNMAEHGVPQTRKRVIFVGVRLDQWRGSFVYPKKTHRLRGDKKASQLLPFARTLREAIGDLPDPGERSCNHDSNNAPISLNYATSKRFATDRRPAPTIVSEAANVQPFVVAGRNPDFHNPKRGSSSPAVTMTSGGSTELSLSDGSIRRMTVRECARVQSFPDWYKFAGSMSDGYMQVGNAVPPLYAKRLAIAILEYDKRKVIA